MKKVLFTLLFLINSVVPVLADCEQHDFGSPGLQYYIYSDGRTWDFTANQNMTVENVETLSRLAGSGTYTLTIEILVNSVQQASWVQTVNTTYTDYTNSQNLSVTLNSGDTITFRISGGTLSTPGGAITGPNYVKLCDSNVNNSSISGIIYQDDGTTPITGDEFINIDVYEHENPDNPITTTAINSADGSFLIQGLVAGVYDLRIKADNYIDEFWASPLSVYYRNQGQSITLMEGENRTDINFQLETGNSISGTVYQTNGSTPLINIGVCAYNDSSCGKMWDFCTESNVDGTYTVRVPDGNFYLDAGMATSYIPEWWSDPSSVRDCMDATLIVASGGSPVFDKNFQLEEGVTISGTIFLTDGVTPITGDTTIGVGVVRDNPCESQGAAYSMPINENDGTYELLVEPGTYYLQVWADNYIDEWWHSSASVYSCAGTESIDVQIGLPVANHNFQLETGAIITGTVYKQNNHTPFTAQECLWVDIITQDPCQYNGQPNFTASVDPQNATYSMHVPDGTYFIMANTCNWFSSEWWATPLSVSTNNCEAAKSLSVTVDNTYPNINFQIGSEFSWNLFLPAIITGKQ